VILTLSGNYGLSPMLLLSEQA